MDYFKAVSEDGLKNISKSNVVLLYGDQDILMDELLELIVDETVENSFRDFDYILLKADSLKGEKEEGEKALTVSDIIEHLEAFPFGGGKKVVAVRNIEKLDMNQKNTLAGYVLTIAPASLLVLMATGKAKAGVSSLLGAKLEKSLKSRTVINCTLKSADMVKWVLQKTAMLTGKTIGQEDSAYLLKRTGTDLRHITKELEKLSCFVEPNFRINKEAIDMCCHQEAQSGVFDLTDAVGMGQTMRALSIFSELMKQQEEPLKLLALLNNHFNLIKQVRELKEKRISPAGITSILQKMGEHPYRVQKAMAIKYFSLSGLRKAHRWLLEADISIKTGRQDPEHVMELLIILLCQEAAKKKAN
ncbi:MAG: DNA polymerase III subunit delta [Candidatus Eremiobacterota bacterium]